MTPSGWYVAAVVLSAAFVSIEATIERRRGGPRSSFVETLGDASHFVGELTLTALLHLNLFAAYRLVEGKLGLLTWDPRAPATWIATVLAVDLVYWVGHVACHRVGVLWALHAVHHQSRQFNFAAGIRGPWLSALQIVPFAIPLLVLGLPSEVLFVVYAGHTTWKLLVHTRLVGKLGLLESVFATPSQHRVHHAQNPRFIDRNFGGLLSVWDRLFGTFQEEDEQPDLAPSADVGTWDPLAQNIAPWRELAARAGERGWLAAIFGPPVALRSVHGEVDGRLARAPRSDPRALPVAARVFVFASFAASLTGAVALTLGAVDPDRPAGWLLGAAVVVGLVAMGRAIDRSAGRTGASTERSIAAGVSTGG
jgi:alkylglycerol monooxygenase